MAQEGQDTKTLFVRSVPFDATSEELSDFFSLFAPVRHAVIVTDKEHNSRGFGFVSFALEEDAKLALEKGRESKFKDRTLRIDIAKRRDRQNKADMPSAEVPEKKGTRLIVRNLPWSMEKVEKLKKQFQRYGTVVECTVPKNEKGKMRGFAFIRMKKFSAAEAAVEKSKGLKIDGREVTVDFAVDKTRWEASGQAKPVFESEKKNEKKESSSEKKSSSESSSESSDESDKEESDKEGEELPVEEKPKPNKQEPYTIFIRNLPYDATKEGLQEHFEQFGPVKYALPVVDKETGMARGTGFVAFKTEDAYKQCLDNAPDSSSSSSSLLVSDDVPPAYIYDGRIMSITSAVDRDRAKTLLEKNKERRDQILGKEHGKQDKRNLFLLNEGRINPTSAMGQLIGKTELEIREKSYKLRIDQLNANPSLHLSLTRLAVRNLPRTLTEKSFKALGRKAVVEFAKEVKQEIRQPLSKEEIQRSLKHKQNNSLEKPDLNKSKKKGVVRQAKILVEVSASGQAGRSKGYGFLEFRDHKSALMALRWLNCHEVTYEEILAGLSPEEQKFVKPDGQKRRLIVEFAIEHAKVVNKRKEKVKNARDYAEMKKKAAEEEQKKKQEEMAKKREREATDETKQIIGNKRRRKNKKKA